MSHGTFAQSLTEFGPAASSPRTPTLPEAQAYCRQLARTHYENFTVVSWLLPQQLRQHFCNIYAYCRWADDLADEVADPQQSHQLLNWWEAQLNYCYSPTATAAQHPVFVALHETVRQFEIPAQPFLDLIAAFRQDQHVTQYETHDDVLDYCRRSANPVGRLILCLGHVRDAESERLSDSICTGLQLANFCQDVANDWDRGRVYLPQQALRKAGYEASHFERREFSPAFREVMRQEVVRAERYLRDGAPLVKRMPAELKFDVALFVAGGLAILEAIRRQNYDVWSRRPALSKFDKLRLAFRCWWRKDVA